MMNDDESSPSFLVQRRSKKNRQTKTQLVFDEQARKEYLKGFHKRKVERRERAQKELEDEIKNDLKNLRQKRREDMRKRHEALGLLDTVENNTKKRTIELKNHTIEIAEIDDQLISNTGLFMGNNQINDNETNEKNDDEPSSKKSKIKTPLSKKMSLLQNMKAPNPMKKGHHNKNKQRRSQTKLGKNGGIQTASKKKRTRK
ncbi:unnamed protein product [Rotaria sordida]|uniref:Nucleolar protein 12 n=1 Tax=Rotaria sordida TaxID=392033 RepID=A0A815A9X9_9BILA|nr:unnamed protein product [Rotaria sordida]CAF1254555.1 unnamed protein product [Rotaria sordida]CAF3783592.1 unnamed protein product [Rotaria sordida]